MSGCMKMNATVSTSCYDCKDKLLFKIKTDKEDNGRTFQLAVFLDDMLAQPLQCFGNCQCCAREMGKKFDASVKPVGKKLGHFEKYIPLLKDDSPNWYVNQAHKNSIIVWFLLKV